MGDGVSMEKIRNLSLKKTMVLYTILSLIVTFFLSVSIIEIAGQIQEEVWWKYVDQDEYYQAMNDRNENFEVVVPRPNQSKMSRMDWHISETCDFLQTYGVLLFSFAGCGIAVSLFYKNKLKRPIQELKMASQMIAEEDLDFHMAYENEDEMGMLCREFERMRGQLEENNRRLWQMIEDERVLRAAIAHDIRSPLAIMRGYQEMLLEFVPEDMLDQEKMMEMLRGGMLQIERMNHFIDSMRKMTKLEELKELEEQTGFILSNSPTQTVGYYPVSELAKVTHPIPLLSLEKTKLISELLDFMKGQEVLFMLKLDGLTTKLIYEDGRLIQASTRGDGEVGEDITHNIPAFLNVPLTIPHKERLVITGESFIPTNDFERLKDTLRDGNGKPYKNGRNFASGSVRSLDPKNCIGRCVRFLPFNVLEGMEDVPFPDSRACKLEGLTHLGFGYCPFFSISGTGLSKEYAEKFIQELVSTAANLHLPIDGIVMIFDSLSYSKSCGKTGHHYKDGLAYKFEDDTYETFLREIEWTPTRFGEIAPVGIFDTVEIDGCDVSRASLHNLTFIKNLELVPGCRILVSKRNMIIPHIEDNLDRGRYTDITPPVCPCCGSKTRTYSRKTSDGRTVETLHCDNPQCDSQITRRFVHFASKKAMNIEGLSEATLEKFLNLGYLHSFQDIYHLEEHREDIVALDGYGEKSFDRLWESINASRRTSFVRYLVSMDIPMIGRTKSRILDTVFSGNLTAFEQAAVGDYDFTQLEDFGEILNHNIHSWFADEANLDLWKNLQNEFTFEQRKEETIMTKENKFTGCTIVATGKLEHFTRDGINDKILELGAKPGSSVTKKTDYLICGEKAGSKLAKAQSLGIPILTEAEFLEMIA